MFFAYERNLSWIENFLENIIQGFFQLDIVFQYGILAIIVYVFVLGSIEFIKKILIYIPRKLIGIIVVIIVFYIVVIYFRS